MHLEVDNLWKSFGSGDRTVDVLAGVGLRIDSGEAMAVTGPSGSGKSTLLHIIGTLEPPSRGTVRFGDVDPFALPEPALAAFRNATIGFVFQDHHLLPQYTVLENVLIPTMARAATESVRERSADSAGVDSDSARHRQTAPERARELLDRVGLGHRLDHRPAELSGGEKQRVAIARALINAPGVVLCDEPTGNLDPATANAVTNLIVKLHTEVDSVLMVVTHSMALADRFERRLELRDGTCSER